MNCVLQIKVNDFLDIRPGLRYEYLVRFSSGNHFVSVNIFESWPDKGVIFGEARLLQEKVALPLLGDVLGLDESDVRGWLLLLE